MDFVCMIFTSISLFNITRPDFITTIHTPFVKILTIKVILPKYIVAQFSIFSYNLRFLDVRTQKYAFPKRHEITILVYVFLYNNLVKSSKFFPSCPFLPKRLQICQRNNIFFKFTGENCKKVTSR